MGNVSKLLIPFILSFFICFGCEKNRQVDYSPAFTAINVAQPGEGRSIDVSKSVVKWRGTKLMGTGSHEGLVKFKIGKLLFSGKQITGGEFIVDMKSIYITDIPLSDPVPRKNLTTHLNSDFDTENFPVSSFIIHKVNYADANHLEITGDLKIMSHSHPIVIQATSNKEQTEFKTEFEFNRFDWKIGENGSWLEQKLVDADVKLSVELYLKGK